MKKTWKPAAAGILNIITGALNALGVIVLIIAIAVISGGTYLWGIAPHVIFPFAAPILITILIIFIIFSVIEAVFPIVGGVFALQRRKWGWALAGSIIAILGAFPLGVASTIFIALSKDEFE